MKGLFISFEGNDGSGKSSVIQTIYQKLLNLGYEVVLTREPGGSKISEKIREIILDKDNIGMDDRTEALLYAASRREHIQKTILPAIKEGKIVLCDRFIDSSLAYQGSARHLGMDNIYNLNLFATEGLLPDLTLYVEIHPEVGLKRIQKNARDFDRLELETMHFHDDVYQGYQELCKKYPQRIVRINGELTPKEVADQASAVVMKWIEGSNEA